MAAVRASARFLAMTTPPTTAQRTASLEHLLVRFGLVTLDQLSTALREETEHGTPFTEALVRDGFVSAEDLARLADRAPLEAPAPIEPETAPEPEPAAEPLPPVTTFAPEPVTLPLPLPAEIALAEPVAEPPAPAVVRGYIVRGRLVNGEDVEIASVADADEAQRIARDAMRACAVPAGADWPVLNGRYVRPEAIVSIEVAERG
jgi:hypothetical protein